MARVLVVSVSPLGCDARVDRQLRALRTAGHEVVSAGFGTPRAPVDRHVELRRLLLSRPALARRLARTQALRLARRWDSAYWSDPEHRAWADAAAQVRPDVVLANDVWAMPPALRTGAPIVLDLHEHSPSERAATRWWRRLMQPYVQGLSDALVPQAQVVTTVSPGVASAYEHDTGIRPEVVTNAPPLAPLEPSPVEHPVRLVHWGVAEPQRRLGDTLALMEHLGDGYALDLVLVGHPREQARLRAQARRDPRIRILEPKPMDELVAFGNAYDVGVFLLPTTQVNHRFALPNKFFEFVQARLAVALGPAPEMAPLAREHGFGIIAERYDPAALAARIAALSRDELAARKAAAHRAAQVLNAEANAERIVSAVDRALELA